MDPSHRIVPAGPSSTASVKDTANHLGLHDSLQYGPRSLATEIKGNSFKGRLDSWDETQDNLKLTLQRNLYGMHAPVRLLMERKMVAMNPHMPGLPNTNLHLDILMGRDEAVEASDIFGGMERQAPQSLHTEMEKKRNI